jgi:prepilin-type N-terminal cleavage/methylation domain-containing protein
MRRGYSLLELLAVVTLIGLLVGVSTLNMHCVSDEARLAAAADQLATAFRLAVQEASRTGRPHLFVVRQGRCVIQRPAWSSDKWGWKTGAEFRLPSKVSVQSADDAGEQGGEYEFRMPIAPDSWTQSVRLRLQLDGGAEGVFEIQAATGTARRLGAS